MLIALELISALITYFVMTVLAGRNWTAIPIFLGLSAVVLLVAAVLLGNVWILFVVLPMLVAHGVVIGAVVGGVVYALLAWVKRPAVRAVIGAFGLALVTGLSFHSQYRAAYEGLTACAPELRTHREALVAFEGMEDKHFNLALYPEFAWVRVKVDHQESFFWGSSKYPSRFDGAELQRVSCDLTRGFSRPIRLDSYSYAIRLNAETGELLASDAAREDDYAYISMKFHVRPVWQKLGTATVLPDGRSVWYDFKERHTRGWNVAALYNGLTVRFDLQGVADEQPVAQTMQVLDIFERSGALVPVE